MFHGLPRQPGIYLHEERSGNLTRKDGTVPKPSLLERYLHRPLESAFDDIDIITYHSTFGAAMSPPQYATQVWMEKEWEDASNGMLVFRKRPTTTVRIYTFISRTEHYILGGTVLANNTKINFRPRVSTHNKHRTVIAVAPGYQNIFLGFPTHQPRRSVLLVVASEKGVDAPVF